MLPRGHTIPAEYPKRNVAVFRLEAVETPDGWVLSCGSMDQCEVRHPPELAAPEGKRYPTPQAAVAAWAAVGFVANAKPAEPCDCG